MQRLKTFWMNYLGRLELEVCLWRVTLYVISLENEDEWIENDDEGSAIYLGEWGVE